MPTPHNEALKEDIAKTVIMPGDPLRAKYIAETFLENYKLVNQVRGMYAYTGYYKGKRITVMAHGMGIPSAGIYSYELFDYYDVDNIIRIGTCGSYSKDLALRSVLLVEETYSDTNFDIEQGEGNIENLLADTSLNKKIEQAASKLNITLTKGKVHCSDAFYTKNDIYEKMYNEHNCLAVEMESYAIFYNARILKKKASCILTVSDNLVKGEKLSSKERQNSFNEMILLALESTLI